MVGRHNRQGLTPILYNGAALKSIQEGFFFRQGIFIMGKLTSDIGPVSAMLAYMMISGNSTEFHFDLETKGR